MYSFYREALRNAPFYGASLNSDVQSAISLIKEVKEKIKIIRLYFLTNGIVDSSSSLNFSENIENGIVVEYTMWDIARFNRINSLNTGDCSIEIDFLLNYKTKIQCLRVEDENPKVDAYFAIMPGNILAKIYNQYKQTLMEGNVRLYLQKGNKVNRQISKTIKERPEMFFSFNNGISATAKRIEFGSGGSKTAPFISKIADLQIVNGGQTTATIAAMQECDLSKVFVPMKISVIKDLDEYSSIVKDISTSANSQSAIKRSDFLSGDEFLQKLEDISRQEIEPRSRTKWYFERKRGQYKNDQSNKIGYEKTLFNATYPKSQVLDKSEVARLATLWDMKPYVACKSKEIVTMTYFSCLSKGNDSINFDSKYYRNIVSLHILFNKINAYVKSNYVRLYSTYNQRITYYVISSISYLTGGGFDLNYIWTNQKVQGGLIAEIKPLVGLVYAHLFSDFRPNYLKDTNCWENLIVKLDDMALLKKALVELSDKSEETEKLKATVYNEESIIEQAFAIPDSMWRAIAKWGQKTGKLSMAERLRALNYADRRKAQERFKTAVIAQNALKLEKKAKDLGFPMDIVW